MAGQLNPDQFRRVPGPHHKGHEGSVAIEALSGDNYLGYLRFDPTQALFEEIEVEPEHRRRGVARSLVGEFDRMTADPEFIEEYGIEPEDWQRTSRTDDGVALTEGLGRDLPAASGWT